MAGLGQPKTGGRQKGTPNKTTKLVRDFFGEVLAEAFKDPQFKPRLVKAIVELQLDPKLFLAVLNHAAGSPPKQIDHTHTLKNRRLEEIVSGVFDEDEFDEEEQQLLAAGAAQGPDDGGGS